MTVTAASRGRPARLAVDLSATLNLVGSLVKYLGISAVVPVPFALANSEPVWPFLAAGAARERSRAGARAGHARRRGGWASARATSWSRWCGSSPAAMARSRSSSRTTRSSGVPSTRCSRACPGFTTTGASAATDVTAQPVSIQIWRQLTIWLGGIGVVALGLAVLPRLRVGGRQLLESELAGPADRRALRTHPRHGAALLAAVRRAHRRRLPRPRTARLARRGAHDGHLPGVRARAQHHRDRGLLHRARVDRRVRRTDPVDRHRRSWRSRA